MKKRRTQTSFQKLERRHYIFRGTFKLLENKTLWHKTSKVDEMNDISGTYKLTKIDSIKVRNTVKNEEHKRNFRETQLSDPVTVVN